jgi:predicted transcriptional regulator
MSEPQQQPPVQDATLSTVEELHKALIHHNLQRLQQIHGTLNERLEQLNKTTDEDVEKKTRELAELEELVKGEESEKKKKVFEEKIDELKSFLAVQKDKDSSEKMKNTLGLVERRFQEMQILGC